jgi:hypothetical protein
VARCLIGRYWCIGTQDLLLLTVNSEISGQRNVLADWETEDILWTWEGKTIAVCVSIALMRITRVGMKYMAVLWDRIVFSLSSNS